MYPTCADITVWNANALARAAQTLNVHDWSHNCAYWLIVMHGHTYNTRAHAKNAPSNSFETWFWEWGTHGIQKKTRYWARSKMCTCWISIRKIGCVGPWIPKGKFNASAFQPTVRKASKEFIEGSLEVKFPTMWTDGKAEVGRVREEKGRRKKIKE